MSDPFDRAYLLQDTFARTAKAVDEVTAGLDAFERERALFSPPDAEIRMPKYGDSLFPTKATHYDGFFVKLEPGQAIKLSGRLPDSLMAVRLVCILRSLVRHGRLSKGALLPDRPRPPARAGWKLYHLPVSR